MPVKCTYSPEKRTLLCELAGEIDHHTAKGLRESIDQGIREHNPSRLIMSFEGVTFMDSSGIGLVMGRYKLMTERDGVVKIARPPAYIKRVLKLAGINKLCGIISTQEEMQ